MNKKIRNRIVILMSFTVLALLCGCSRTQGEVEPPDAAGDRAEAVQEGSETNNADEEGNDKEGPKKPETAASDTDEEEAEDYWKGPDENIWDGGPDFTSLATQFNGIFRDLTIEEAAEKYAITLVEGGKYAGYEGDIGDIIPQYKDIDLDGDRKTDVIRREGAHYVIECSSAGSFETDDFSASPNEGEIFEFEDTACRNIDEIMIAHYTFGTGGPVVWDTAVWSYQKGKWKAYPIIDDKGINSGDLRDYIEKRTGNKYEPGSVTVSAADMTTLLLNFGYKDGPDQVTDYEAVNLYKSFMPDYFDERGDYSFSEGSGMYLILNYWPLEISGEPVELTGELQNELNVFMSNFSEQNYRQGPFEATMAHFALQWSKINKALKPVQKDGKTYYRISHSDINGILGRYFMTNLEEGEFDDCDIDNDYGGFMEYVEGEGGYYCEPAADGDMYVNNAFTVVSSAESLGYSNPWTYLRLYFTVYRLNEDDYDKHGIGKEQYSLSAGEAAKLADKGRLIKAYEGMATVTHTDDGYALFDYMVK